MRFRDCCFLLLICTTYVLSSCEDNEKPRRWVQKASPDAEYGGLGFAVYSFVADKEAYIAAHNGVTSELNWWKYNPASNRWTKEEMSPLTTYRRDAISTSDNSGKNGYAGLGFTVEISTDGEPIITSYRDLWEFNPDLAIWRQLPDFPGLNQFSWNEPPVAFVVTEKLYIIGPGYSDFWALDLKDETWLQRSTPVLLPEHRKTPGRVFSYGGAGYLMIDSEASHPGGELVIYKYSPDADTWSIVFNGDAFLDLREHALFVLGDKLYLGSNLWKKYDLKTMVDEDYFGGAPDTARNYTYPAVAGFSINNAGYVLYSNRAFWQFNP